MMRIRITFSKTEAMRYTGHLDLHRAWERTFRRAGLPIAYSQGFHPQPRINLACALPLGFTSICDLADAWLDHDLPVSHIEQALVNNLPPGIIIQHIEGIDSHLPSLQSQVVSAVYSITCSERIPNLSEKITIIQNSTSLPRERRNKSYDLRLLIEELYQAKDDNPDHPHLILRMAAREGATGRPEEVLAVMGIPYETTRIQRINLMLRVDNG